MDEGSKTREDWTSVSETREYWITGSKTREYWTTGSKTREYWTRVVRQGNIRQLVIIKGKE